MGFRIYLEVDIGDILRVIRSDEWTAGKAFTSFENIHSGYHYRELFSQDSPEYRWFTRFEELAKIRLNACSDALYSGDWNYHEDEYERFQKCVKRNPFKSEEEYREGIRTLNKKWTRIEDLIEVVKEILRIFPEMGEEETHWYSPQDTVLDFEGLLDTLFLAKKRGGEKVRIKVV